MTDEVLERLVNKVKGKDSDISAPLSLLVGLLPQDEAVRNVLMLATFKQEPYTSEIQSALAQAGAVVALLAAAVRGTPEARGQAKLALSAISIHTGGALGGGDSVPPSPATSSAQADPSVAAPRWLAQAPQWPPPSPQSEHAVAAPAVPPPSWPASWPPTPQSDFAVPGPAVLAPSPRWPPSPRSDAPTASTTPAASVPPSPSQQAAGAAQQEKVGRSLSMQSDGEMTGLVAAAPGQQPPKWPLSPGSLNFSALQKTMSKKWSKLAGKA